MKYSHLENGFVNVFLPQMKNIRINAQNEVCHIHIDNGKLSLYRWVLPPVNHRPNS